MPQALPIAPLLLGWYDRAARALPWRVPPEASRSGILPDPYRVWLSEVMLQQTTVAAVKEYFHRFTTRWPDVQALAAAEDAEVMAEWAGLGYYARARNLLACARAVAARGGFPSSEAELLALPGIGPYTAAAISAIGFGRPAVVVDGNVERVVARLFALETPLPQARPELKRLAARISPQERPGDFAQAMMDLGATICTPRKPRCPLCPIESACEGAARGIAESLPVKAAKPPKPVRRGIAYVAIREDGQVLLETRPPKGLLGGTLGFPGSEWNAAPEPAPPLSADWQVLPGTLRHTFTHFHLDLAVAMARVPLGSNPERGQFQPAPDPEALPSLMRKVWERAMASEDPPTPDLFGSLRKG